MSTIHPDNYRFLQEHVRRQCGIVIDDDKHYLVEARLMPLAFDYGIKNLDDLCLRLRLLSDISLQRRVIEAMTTNETYFFREMAHFDALYTHILPPLMAARQTEQNLTFWSAASSTGQEAYSIAIHLCEMGLESWNIRIKGTDICEPVIERASAGIYNEMEMARGLPPALRAKYFVRLSNDSWEIRQDLRRMASFQLLDLRYNIRSLGLFDVVFCRNVLIYFDQITKTRIIQDIRAALRPGGYLFLGASEVSLPVGPGFQRVVVGDATFYQAL